MDAGRHYEGDGVYPAGQDRESQMGIQEHQ